VIGRLERKTKSHQSRECKNNKCVMELPSMTSADGAAETNAAATTAAAAASETSAAAAAADGVSWKSIGADGLWRELRQPEPQVTVLDCRSAADFTACHIRRAVHLSLPSIMLRRLAGGKVSIASVLKCSEARHQLQNAYGKHTFVLCGDTGADSAAPASLTPRHAAHEMLPILHKSLVQDGCLVVCLEGNRHTLLACRHGRHLNATISKKNPWK